MRVSLSWIALRVCPTLDNTENARKTDMSSSNHVQVRFDRRSSNVSKRIWFARNHAWNASAPDWRVTGTDQARPGGGSHALKNESVDSCATSWQMTYVVLEVQRTVTSEAVQNSSWTGPVLRFSVISWRKHATERQAIIEDSIRCMNGRTIKYSQGTVINFHEGPNLATGFCHSLFLYLASMKHRQFDRIMCLDNFCSCV